MAFMGLPSGLNDESILAKGGHALMPSALRTILQGCGRDFPFPYGEALAEVVRRCFAAF